MNVTKSERFEEPMALLFPDLLMKVSDPSGL